MAHDDEYADILGGPILQNPNTVFFGKWSRHSMVFRVTVILALALLLSFLAVRAWDIWKKNQELGYRKAMRRKHGIPDSDCRPFAVAYAAATRARGEREARERQNSSKVKIERPVTDHPLPSSDMHGLRRRVAEPAFKPHLYQQPTTRRTISGYDHRPRGLDFAQRYYPRLQDGVLPVTGESVSPAKGRYLLYSRASRKDLVLDANAVVEGKKRAFNDDDSLEPETSKKSRVDGEDLIDGDEEPVWYEEEAQPTQRGSKRTFDSDEEGDHMRTDGRDKRPRNMSRGQTPDDQEMEDVEDDDVAELERNPRGKKRGRAEAASTFGGDDGEEVLDHQDDKAHRHRKRRTVQSRKSDISSRSSKLDRDPESPGSEGGMGDSRKHGEQISKKKKKKGGKKASLDEAASHIPNRIHDPVCGSRKIGEEWESNGVQYKLGNDGQRLRLTLVKKARSKYSMPKDSQHPDKQANMEIYVETWLTDEQHKHAEERQELVWQETPRASAEPSTPGETPESPMKTGKDLLWDSMKSSPIPRRAFRQSLTSSPAKVNPFQQPLPQASTRRRVASSNSHPLPLDHGVAEVLSRPGFRAFSKWEKQDLEAEAMARMRARMLEQKKAETPSRKTCEVSASTTAPELGPKTSIIPIITFTPPPPATSAAPAPSGTEAKPAPPTFSFGPTSSNTDASKVTVTATSNTTPAGVTHATSAPAADTRGPLPIPSVQQTVSVTPTFSLGQPTTQPPATSTVPSSVSASSTSAIPNLFATPAASSTFAPAVTPSSTSPFSFGLTPVPSIAPPAATASSTTPSFSFGSTPSQLQVATPTTSSTFPVPAFASAPPSSTETNKLAQFTFAKPNPQPFAASSTLVQGNPPSSSTPPNTTASTSAQSAPAPLKFDFSRKTNSTSAKPAPTSSTAVAADTSKPAGIPFSFSMAPVQASSSSTPVFGSGGNTVAASKPAETSEEAPKTVAPEPEKPKFSFSGSTGAPPAPKSTFSFTPQSGTSVFATTTSGSDTKKETPLSIFGTASTAKEDASGATLILGSSNFSGASSTNSHQDDANKAIAPASAFGGSGFSANGVFGKSSAPPRNGDANMSTSAPKNAFGNGVANNIFSIAPTGSPVAFGSAQPGTTSFGNESAKIADGSKSSFLSNTPVFSFGKKDDATVPSSSGVSTSTSTFSFQKPVFGEPSSGSSNSATQPQSVFGKPSTPTPSAFGFGSSTGNGSGSAFNFGGQSGGQNQQQ